MLLRFDPFRELDRRSQQVWSGRSHSMPMDAYRSGDHYVVQFDLPGVDPSSIDVTVEKGVLTVAAERTWQRAEEDIVVASERYHGSFTRRLHLSDALDVDNVEASHDHGVLTLRIPVAQASKPRRVEITAGGNGKATASAAA